MKKIFLGLTGVVAVAAPIATVVSCGKHSEAQFSFARYKANQDFDAIQFDYSAATEQADNLTAFAKEADINLFACSFGVQPFNVMLKESMIASKYTETHISIVKGVKALAHQDMVNVDALNKMFALGNPKSKATVTNDGSNTNIIDEWYDIIKANKDKKINIWWNVEHLEHLCGTGKHNILEFAGFKNVQFQLLEDGPSNVMYPHYTNPATVEKFKTPEDFAKSTTMYESYIATAVFPNMHAWFSKAANIDQVSGNAKYSRYRKFDAVKEQDTFFSERSMLNADGTIATTGTGNRLTSLYPLISGIDWHKELDLYNQAMTNGKKALIIIGNGTLGTEKQFIEQVWNRYHNEYNIFYKGHPGHADVATWFVNDFGSSHSDVYNFTAEMQSEEMTKRFAEGFKFDGVCSVRHSGALEGFPKEYYNGDKALDKIFLGAAKDDGSFIWPDTNKAELEAFAQQHMH